MHPGTSFAQEAPKVQLERENPAVQEALFRPYIISGPRLFTKILKPLVAILSRVGVRLVIYLDDMLILNQTKEGLIKDRDSTLHILGWVIKWKKSVLDPTQIIEFLEFKLNSLNIVVSLPQEKINNILLKCQASLETSQTTITN